jgi:hypothetical protein
MFFSQNQKDKTLCYLTKNYLQGVTILHRLFIIFTDVQKMNDNNWKEATDEKKWKDGCPGKKQLVEDLLSGAIPLDHNAMKPSEAYKVRPIFSDYGGYKNFPSRLRSARNQVSKKKDTNAFDEEACIHDRKLYPVVTSTCNSQGLLRWGGSRAEKLLKKDITDGRHHDMAPRDLYSLREEYQKFPLDRFREHIHQEVRRRKFLAQYA